ncbi:MAG: cytochrome-c peroxidase [Flavobacteriales bacterium]|nr:cytochrome-c peroxidase [Flavobacteriales bacterium]
MKEILLIFTLLTSISFIDVVLPNKEVSEKAVWPTYYYDTLSNPLTEDKIYLGRVLFYDPILSIDSTISCASCHSQYSAFTHVDHPRSHGVFDQVGDRNSPSLMNLAYQDKFMWDGAIHNLDAQALAPISEVSEMGETIGHVIEKLDRIPAYHELYSKAFGSSEITGEKTLKAIGAFMATLESKNSKYDQMMAGTAEFTEQENNGYNLFLSNCAICHKEPLFTTNEFVWNGLPLDTALNDLGRMKITHLSMDSLHFKIPTLRNVEFSYPYMHDGRMKTLRDVLNFYTSELPFENTEIDHRLNQPIILTDNEKTDLIAFLLTLTDKEFLFNKKYSFPFDFFFPSTKDE